MINYSVSQMVNPQDQDEVKYYAHAQAVRNLDINDFAKHIAAHGCVYSRADIATVLAAETAGQSKVELKKEASQG